LGLCAQFGTPDITITSAVGAAAVATVGYMVNLLRRGKQFSLLDAVILVVLIAIVSAAAVPIFETLSHRAKISAMSQNLHTLRSQIELYKVEHNGQPPLLYEGKFPQMTTATNATGVPGAAGPAHPLGPYLRAGVPINPLTGGYKVVATDVFPPKEPSGNGGWLYHQPTGQIAPDVEGYLEL